MAASPRLAVEPKMLEWACDRSGKTRDDLRAKFPKLDAWIAGETQPTTRQLQHFADVTYTAFGQLFMREPPSDLLSIPDFRVGPNVPVRPSPHLRDTISHCRLSQLWYLDYLDASPEEALVFADVAAPNERADAAARAVADATGFGLPERDQDPNWSAAFRRIVQRLRSSGVLVFISGIVGANTRRTLNVGEFRGFALADPAAPLIFVNGRDAKAAQMFTLAHELGHILRGESGLDDVPSLRASDASAERWCDNFAAELLVPLADLRTRFSAGGEIGDQVMRLASRYKVSRLVVLRRLLAADLISRRGYRELYSRFLAAYRRSDQPAAREADGGGDFYRTFFARHGREFAWSVVSSTLAGETTYTEMSSLLGVKRLSTFDNIARELGLAR